MAIYCSNQVLYLDTMSIEMTPWRVCYEILLCLIQSWRQKQSVFVT